MSEREKEILLGLLEKKINLIASELVKINDEDLFNHLYKKFSELNSLEAKIGIGIIK